MADFGSAVDAQTINDCNQKFAKRCLGLYPDRGPSQDEETREYMPPEVRLSTSLPFARFGTRNAIRGAKQYDMWSIGIVILELLLANDNPPVIKMKIVHNHTTNDNLLTITIVVQFILGPGYPEEMPCRIIILEDDDMYNTNNDDKLQKLDGNQCKILQNILDKEALENIGMPMIYTLVECVKEWLETNENDLMIRDDTNKQTTNMHNKTNNTKVLYLKTHFVSHFTFSISSTSFIGISL